MAQQRHDLPFVPEPGEPFPTFCVSRLPSDPGGLPNCTDAFGGESRDPAILGNEVNQACLDLP